MGWQLSSTMRRDDHAPLHKGRGRAPSLQVEGMAIILLNGKGYDAHLHLNAKGMFTFLFKVKGLLILLSIGDGNHSFHWERHGHCPVNAKGESTCVIRADAHAACSASTGIKSSCACFEIIAAEARNSKDFDECAVDFVALIGYRTQALTVKRLAGRCGPIPTSMI